MPVVRSTCRRWFSNASNITYGDWQVEGSRANGQKSKLPKIAGFHIEFFQLLGKSFEPLDDDVNHRRIMAGCGLDMAVRDPGRRPASDAVISIPHVLVHDEIHRARFVFECDERDTFGRAGTLPEYEDAGDNYGCVVRQFNEPLRRRDAELLELVTIERDWMSTERQ